MNDTIRILKYGRTQEYMQGWLSSGHHIPNHSLKPDWIIRHPKPANEENNGVPM